ncbi:MAG: hypothetical protein AAB695_01910, partial [Patescibacteria group bacterium]
VKAYKIVRKELELYNIDIAKKPEIIALTKVDLVSNKEMQEKIKALESVSKEVMPVSILDDQLIENFKKWITN